MGQANGEGSAAFDSCGQGNDFGHDQTPGDANRTIRQYSEVQTSTPEQQIKYQEGYVPDALKKSTAQQTEPVTPSPNKVQDTRSAQSTPLRPMPGQSFVTPPSQKQKTLESKNLSREQKQELRMNAQDLGSPTPKPRREKTKQGVSSAALLADPFVDASDLEKGPQETDGTSSFLSRSFSIFGANKSAIADSDSDLRHDEGETGEQAFSVTDIASQAESTEDEPESVEGNEIRESVLAMPENIITKSTETIKSGAVPVVSEEPGWGFPDKRKTKKSRKGGKK